MLPSQVLESGSDIDIKTALLGQQYENYCAEHAKEVAEGRSVNHGYSMEQLVAMRDSVKQQ